jgi:predicted Rossmann fold nucleotide-binding protein DprA/Smf involved in DNA uptake
MAEVGTRAVSLGRGIVSGGAVGCDSAAEAAALGAGGTVLRLLPQGLGLRRLEDDAVRVTLAAPGEPFSRALAMERNALIYAAADATIVGHARLREGGTWHGASDALRRRLGRLLVRPDDSPAALALKALGAGELAKPVDLGDRLAESPPQGALFAYERKL